MFNKLSPIKFGKTRFSMTVFSLLLCTSPSYALDEKPADLINPETGELVTFTRAYWLPEDVAGQNRQYSCIIYSYVESEGRFVFGRQFGYTLNPDVNESCLSTPERTNCGGEGTRYTPDFDSYTYYVVVDGEFRAPDDQGAYSLETDWIEAGFDISEDSTAEQGFRYWYKDDAGGDYYSTCSGISPSGVAPADPPASDCEDTAPVGDGWGWDGTSSCRLTAAPSICIDSPPTGDGWGWDGVTSCEIAPVEDLCVDTAPAGDGWGWDGAASCQIAVIPSVCIDTDPTGDGWGWDGVSSCRVNDSQAPCIDSDGDGWGWNGTASCRPE